MELRRQALQYGAARSQQQRRAYQRKQALRQAMEAQARAALGQSAVMPEVALHAHAHGEGGGASDDDEDDDALGPNHRDHSVHGHTPPRARASDQVPGNNEGSPDRGSVSRATSRQTTPGRAVHGLDTLGEGDTGGGSGDGAPGPLEHTLGHPRARGLQVGHGASGADMGGPAEQEATVGQEPMPLLATMRPSSSSQAPSSSAVGAEAASTAAGQALRGLAATARPRGGGRRGSASSSRGKGRGRGRDVRSHTVHPGGLGRGAHTASTGSLGRRSAGRRSSGGRRGSIPDVRSSVDLAEAPAGAGHIRIQLQPVGLGGTLDPPAPLADEELDRLLAEAGMGMSMGPETDKKGPGWGKRRAPVAASS